MSSGTRQRTDAEKADLKRKGFQKGKSGNPKGRPPVPPEVKEAAKAHTMTSLDTLVDVMMNSKNDNARVTAAVSMLNRGWGQPKQSVEVDHSHRLDITEALARLEEHRRVSAMPDASMMIDAELVQPSAKH